MTEQDWLISTHPDLMLRFLHGVEASRRKLRLFGCSCFPVIRHLWLDTRVTRGVEVAERYADGLASPWEKEKARYSAMAILVDDRDSNTDIVAEAVAALNHNAETASWTLAMAEACVAAGWHRDDWRSSRGSIKFLSMCDPLGVVARDEVRSVQCDRLRCIFGNPFRPVAVDPSCQAWNDGTLAWFAQAIYDERSFERLPVLADVLEEAGCTNGEILTHCRRPGTHVRGCWVVDLILGKE